MFGISLPPFIYVWVVKREYALQFYIFCQDYMINTDTRAQQRLSKSFKGMASCTLPEQAGGFLTAFEWLASSWFSCLPDLRLHHLADFYFPSKYFRPKRLESSKRKLGLVICTFFCLAGSGGKSNQPEKKKSLFFKTVNWLRELVCKKSSEAEQNVNFAGWERFSSVISIYS